MQVSEEVKNAYSKSSLKELNILFPDLGLEVPTGQTHGQSMNLVEMLISDDNVEFVGCIASKFEIVINGVSNNIKGEKIEAFISADGTEPVPLFHGVVDKAERQTNRNFKKIVAYDELYTKGEIDLAAWYNSLTFPITLKAFRDSLFAYIGLEQETRDLPNDSITINKEYAPTQLRAISVIKAICQINGAFGIVNRYGKFEYRILSTSLNKSAYPGLTLFPGSATYPGISTESGEQISVKDVAYYKKVDYEEYSVKPVEKVTIRQTDSEVGISYGEGTNNYIIQGNFFTLNKGAEELLTIAEKIHGAIAGIEFVPFTAENSGYPFVEVGLDGVSYYAYNFEASARARSADIYTKKTFYVFKRTLSGIQALKDVYSVQGEEYQSEFVTDVSTQVEQIKKNLSHEISNKVTSQLEISIPQYTYSKEEVNEMTLKVVSVSSVPTNWQANTIYLIQGEVEVN